MSLFFTFEGGEGCGKSTQIKKLSEALATRAIPHVLTREPGGTPLGQTIRGLLLQGDVGSMDPLTELMLYAADRAEHVRNVIIPALTVNKIVLCDRYTDATVAYQGYGRGLDLHSIEVLNRLATDGIFPNFTFLLDCPIEVGLIRSQARLKNEASPEDRFERLNVDFHRRVREGYLKLAEQEPERFLVLDATQNIEAIHLKILDKFDSLRKRGPNG